MVRRVLRNIPDSQGRVFVNRSYLGFCFALHDVSVAMVSAVCTRDARSEA